MYELNSIFYTSYSSLSLTLHGRAHAVVYSYTESTRNWRRGRSSHVHVNLDEKEKESLQQQLQLVQRHHRVDYTAPAPLLIRQKTIGANILSDWSTISQLTIIIAS